MSDTAIVRITVIDVPEKPVMPITTLHIDENSIDETSVGTPILTKDPDITYQGYLKHTLPGPPFPFYVDHYILRLFS